MPGGGIGALMATGDPNRVEAPVTWKTYAMCCFAAFGGIFFGYDSGYIGGVQGMTYFIHVIDGPNATALTPWKQSLIVSILSAGTFFGAIIAGDLADFIGRRTTIICGCAIFSVGAVLQTASHGLALLVVGRLVAGFGIGFVSAIIILYMSELAPRKFRGTIVSGYQFCVTVGLLLAACVTYGTEHRTDSGSYRIPTALQLLWAIILAIGLFILPESPRYWVKRGNVEKARTCLARVRDQPPSSEFIETELAEIIANAEYERMVIPDTGYIGGWMNCFSGSVFKANSNLRRTILGTSMQMMQQWTGVNFIFYFSTPFLQSSSNISNVFLISLIFTLVNVLSTPISFYTIEKFGRRPLLIWGAALMTVCQFIVGAIGVTIGFDDSKMVPQPNGAAPKKVAVNPGAANAQVAFICIYIFGFASTWGPGAWVVIGEIFPLPIRSRGVGLSTSSNWLWNCIIAVVTPYLVGSGKGDANLQSNVFFLWGSTCLGCFIYAYFLVYETKGLSLEQVDRMMEECTPRTSAAWRAQTTFSAEAGIDEKTGTLKSEVLVEVERHGSVG